MRSELARLVGKCTIVFPHIVAGCGIESRAAEVHVSPWALWLFVVVAPEINGGRWGCDEKRAHSTLETCWETLFSMVFNGQPNFNMEIADLCCEVQFDVNDLSFHAAFRVGRTAENHVFSDCPRERRSLRFQARC